MEYTVKWIINGEITIKAENKQKAEIDIKDKVKVASKKK